MTHPCVWASNKGRELKLSCPERVTLWQLAERAASRGYCWPSITQIMVDTGLARATVIDVLRSLAAKALIEIEKVGKQGHNYRVLQPVQNKTGDRSKIELVNRSKSEPVPVDNRSKSEPVTGSKTASNRFKIATQTGSNLNPNLKENHKLTTARDAREPQTEVLSSEQAGKQAAAQQPATLPEATAAIVTTNGGSHDPFADDGGESKAFASRILGRPVHLAAEQPDTITEDDTPQTEADRARMAAQLAQLARDLGRSKRHFALLPGVERSPSEQQDDTLGLRRPTAAPLSAEQLAAARRSVGIPVAANA